MANFLQHPGSDLGVQVFHGAAEQIRGEGLQGLQFVR